MGSRFVCFRRNSRLPGRAKHREPHSTPRCSVFGHNTGGIRCTQARMPDEERRGQTVSRNTRALACHLHQPNGLEVTRRTESPDSSCGRQERRREWQRRFVNRHCQFYHTSVFFEGCMDVFALLRSNMRRGTHSSNAYFSFTARSVNMRTRKGEEEKLPMREKRHGRKRFVFDDVYVAGDRSDQFDAIGIVHAYAETKRLPNRENVTVCQH